MAAVLVAGGGSSNSNSSSSTIPPVTPARGTTLGSDLSGTSLGSCFGGPPETCTVVQYALAGRPTVSSIDGVVTRWGVRGRGRIALQVVRFSGTGVAAVAQSDFETLTVLLVVRESSRAAGMTASGVEEPRHIAAPR